MPVLLTATVVGKALVQKGLLGNADIIAEIMKIHAASNDPLVKAECLIPSL